MGARNLMLEHRPSGKLGPHCAPAISLALLLLASATILGAGLWLARRETVTKLPRDQRPLEGFAAEFEREFERLDSLYQDHLLALKIDQDDFDLRRQAEGVAGLLGITRLARNGAFSKHLDVRQTMPAVPVALVGSEPFGRKPMPIRLDDFSREDAKASRWLDEPGKPLLHIRRLEHGYVVSSVDRQVLRDTLSAWLRGWISLELEPLQAGGGGERLVDFTGNVVEVNRAGLDQAPDVVLPLRTRFGSWRLESWQPRQTSVAYHSPTLVGASTLAVLVGLLGMAVFAQQRRAWRLAEQRVSFVNRVSHELRAPLTNILLNADLVAGLLGSGSTKARQRLSLLQEEAQRLSRLIGNVLTFAKREREAAPPTLQACRPRELVDSVVAQFAPALARRSIVVNRQGVVEEPLWLDADAVTEILANLIANAEKYAAGGSLTIHEELADEQLTISLADEGPGIPEEDTKAIFLPFHRLSQAVTEGATGVGLGLTIARDLAERQGGSLELRPAAHGATFALTLPARRAA